MSKIIEFSPGFSFSQHRSKLADAHSANVFNPEKLAEETESFLLKAQAHTVCGGLGMQDSRILPLLPGS